MGTFDGPGLRLVVFLQGCNFRCLYCANPDTIDACGGKPTPAEEILRMATDQKPFFGRRGGVTFSGGEPTFQATALVVLAYAVGGSAIWFAPVISEALCAVMAVWFLRRFLRKTAE